MITHNVLLSRPKSTLLNLHNRRRQNPYYTHPQHHQNEILFDCGSCEEMEPLKPTPCAEREDSSLFEQAVRTKHLSVSSVPLLHADQAATHSEAVKSTRVCNRAVTIALFPFPVRFRSVFG